MSELPGLQGLPGGTRTGGGYKGWRGRRSYQGLQGATRLAGATRRYQSCKGWRAYQKIPGLPGAGGAIGLPRATMDSGATVEGVGMNTCSTTY